MDALSYAREEAAGLRVDLRVVPQPHDEYLIEPVAGGTRVTASNARSCLHAVYHLRRGRPAGRYRAAFAIRGINTCESLPCHTPEQLRTLIDRMGRWGMNTLIVHTVYGWRRHRELIVAECAKRGIDLVFYTYTSLAFLPPDAPSDWLAKDAEGRPLTTHPVCETRPCLAEPEGLAAFKEGAQRYFAGSVTDASSVLAMTGDGYGHCRCPACRTRSPSAQWQPLLERFLQAGRSQAPGKRLETIVYVQRYAVPDDTAAIRGLDRIMFDLHQRCRWRPLGTEHPPVGHAEAEVDPRASGIPLNRYLLDRLGDWRAAFPGKLYVFENLNVHATLSCPQPNTGVLLQDLRMLRQIGVDGVVYEVLVGLESFDAQLSVLAEGLWDPDAVRPTPTAVETWCTEHSPPHPLFFLEKWGFPWTAFADQWEPVLRTHMENVRGFYAEKSASPTSRGRSSTCTGIRIASTGTS